MKSTRLVIFDVSPLVYAGSCVDYDYMSYGSQKSGEKVTVQGLPLGGLYNALEKIVLRCSEGATPVAVFDSRTAKKEQFPEYKGNRKGRKPIITLQLRMLEDICGKVGIPSMKLEGFEADDLIYEVVRKNRGAWHYIDIVTGDSDIAGAIYNDYIRIVGATLQSPTITRENFESCIRSGARVAFNTVLPYIALLGKPSNNVPKLNTLSVNPAEFYVRYVEHCRQNTFEKGMCSELPVFIAFWKREYEAGGITGDDIVKLHERCKLVYPLSLSEEESRRIDAIRTPRELDERNLAFKLNIKVMEGLLCTLRASNMAALLKIPGVDNFSRPTADWRRFFNEYKRMYEAGILSVDEDAGFDICVERTAEFSFPEGDF